MGMASSTFLLLLLAKLSKVKLTVVHILLVFDDLNSILRYIKSLLVYRLHRSSSLESLPFPGQTSLDHFQHLIEAKLKLHHVQLHHVFDLLGYSKVISLI